MENIDNEAKAEALYKKLKAATSISQDTGLEYEKVYLLNPKHVGALWEAGRFFDGEHDYEGNGSYWFEFKAANREKAINCFRRIIELDPNFSEAYKRLAKYCDQDKQKSLQHYRKQHNQKPENYAAIASLGKLYRSMKRYKEAIGSFKKCLQHNEKDLIALHGLAAVYEDQGNFEEALECLKRCNQINNKSVETHAQLGRVYDKMGKINETLNEFRWCIQLQSGHKQAHAYLNRHGQLRH